MELLPWDSEFWGVSIGRVTGPPDEAIRWADDNAVACLYYLAEPQAAHAAEGLGFRLMDVRVELRRAAGLERSSVRSIVGADLETMRAIARTSHRTTRFYADPRFPNERCDDLYDTWLSKSSEGWADAVLVVEADGAPAGYVTCHADEARSRGSVGLIAVAEAARGQGLGTELVRGATAWCAARGLAEIGVVTQAVNLQALNVFVSCGFLVEDVGLWFHRWVR